MYPLVTDYEPMTVFSGGPVDLYELSPGVRGYAIQVGDKIYIPLIEAILEGNGCVGIFLNSLSKRCVIANVTSKRLQGMLERRGYVEHIEESEMGPCDVWQRQ